MTPSDAPSAVALPEVPGCCSDLELDQLALGELDDADAARLRAHLADSPRCAARFQTVTAVQAAWRDRAPPLRVAQSTPTTSTSTSTSTSTTTTTAAATANTVISLAEARRKRAQAFGAGASVLAAAAAVVLFVRRPDDGGVRAKGPGVVVSLTTTAANGAVVDVFSGDVVGRADSAALRAHARTQPARTVAVLLDRHVVARGVANENGDVSLGFSVAGAGVHDVVVAACTDALADVVDDVTAAAKAAGCSLDQFAVRLAPPTP